MINLKVKVLYDEIRKKEYLGFFNEILDIYNIDM